MPSIASGFRWESCPGCREETLSAAVFARRLPHDGPRSGCLDPGTGRPEGHGWAERLKARADELLDNRLTFFNLEKVFLGDPIDWNRDHESGKPAPRRLSQTIDYRDYRCDRRRENGLGAEPPPSSRRPGKGISGVRRSTLRGCGVRQIASWIDDESVRIRDELAESPGTGDPGHQLGVGPRSRPRPWRPAAGFERKGP